MGPTLKWQSNILTLFFAMLLNGNAAGQDSALSKKWELNGYIKNLESLNFDKHFRNLVSSNLLHNRINLKWMPSEYVNGALEWRNRLFWGEEISADPGFNNKLRNGNEWVDLSKTWINKPNFVLHSNIERLWVEYTRAGWNMRAGRQRINWGITTLWNPNDIFNSYNFLDVDYEERPGSDAIKIKRQFRETGNLEFALASSGQNYRTIGAFKWFGNRHGYDYQLIAGWYRHSFTTGAGWAGNIGNAGFKGEWMYFSPGDVDAGLLNLAIEADYMFKKGWYLNVGSLFNSNGLSHPIEDWEALDFDLSPKNMLPVRWALSVTGSKNITPILTVNASVLYAPGTNLLILLPGVNYNLATNLDADLLWQSFFAETNAGFEGFAHRCFIRLRWSF